MRPYTYARAGTEDFVPRDLVDLVPQALARAEPRPVLSVYSDVSLELAEQFNVSLKGEASPEDLVRSLRVRLQRVLDVTVNV